MATEKKIIIKQFNGTDYDTLYPKTTSSQIDDVYTENQVLSNDTVTKYKLPSGSVPDAVFNKLLEAVPWTLIQEYKTAGSYIWTAPDLYGGASYKIGVYMVGGGGSGAAGQMNGAGTAICGASGGASGYGKNVEMTVTPGQQIAAVVGTGGKSKSGFNPGDAGGTTSFNNITVNGGSGGKARSFHNFSGFGADGGQGSDACLGASEHNARVYGSCVTKSYYYTPGGRSQSPRESQNRFDPGMVTLCAGGFASWNHNQTGFARQTIDAMPDGTKGGDGATASNAVARGGNATGNGNGGGAAFIILDTAGTPISGAGSPGMILIYAKAV